MYQKYKDKNPQETVKTAQRILNKWNISVEEIWYENLGNLYSLALQIEKTDFRTFGKGTSKEFALASAYGEMLERLQNMSFFRILGSSCLKDKNLYDDDTFIEKNMESDLFHEKIEKWLGKVGNNCRDNEFIKKLENFYKKTGRSIRFYHFRGFQDEEILDIPQEIIDIYYGTNGMAAGNTFYEAFVQGLSEILERFVIKKIMKEDIVPPDVTKYIMDKMPEAKKWICDIESMGSYKIELKDLSLGMKIPAIGLILYNQKEASYFVKVAVHPTQEVATERCFTELMQGQNIKDYFAMTNAEEFEFNIKDDKNLSEIFVYGSGRYPITLFAGEPSYEPYLPSKTYLNNEEMARYLAKLVYDMGYRIYIYNATKSDIFAYQIIVPGMSEISNVLDDKVLDEYMEFEKIEDVIQKGLNNITVDEANDIILYIEKRKISGNTRLNYFLTDVRVNDDCVYGMTTINLFMCLLYMKVKKYDKASSWLEKYVNDLDRTNDISKYYYCFCLYLKLISKKVTKDVANEYIKKFYSNEIVEMINEDFCKNPFEAFAPLQCKSECKKCVHSAYCITQYEQSIYYNIRRNEKFLKEM